MSTSPSRRQRLRNATFEEIVATVRELLNSGEDVSLRATASAMGLTPPALYRYVDSLEALNAMVAGSILKDLTARMSEIAEEHAGDATGQLVAATAYLRSWALTNRCEFELVFTTSHATTPTTDALPVRIDMDRPEHPGGILPGFFGGLFARLVEQGLVTVPTSDQLGEEILALVDEVITDEQRPLLDELGAAGPGTFWALKKAWTRLYGVLTMEVFGQIERPIIDSGLMFESVMKETFDSLGMRDNWSRLIGIARQVWDRGPFNAVA